MTDNSSESRYPGPDKCIVFWDYENIPIPHNCQMRHVINVLRERIWKQIGSSDASQHPVRFKLYIRASSLNQHLQDDMDVMGVEHINISSHKPESVDKRMLVDIALTVLELEKCHKSNAIAVITGDRDFGHLLSRLRGERTISHSLLICWTKNNVNLNLMDSVDFVINQFNDCSFKVCPEMKRCRQINCDYYHPKHYNAEIARNPFLKETVPSNASSHRHHKNVRKIRKHREFQSGLDVAEHRKMRENRRVNHRENERKKKLKEKRNPFIDSNTNSIGINNAPNPFSTNQMNGGLKRDSHHRMDTDPSRERGKGNTDRSTKKKNEMKLTVLNPGQTDQWFDDDEDDDLGFVI